jgi:hypothetical protein
MNAVLSLKKAGTIHAAVDAIHPQVGDALDARRDLAAMVRGRAPAFASEASFDGASRHEPWALAELAPLVPRSSKRRQGVTKRTRDRVCDPVFQ